jgi:hypothetical protein
MKAISCITIFFILMFCFLISCDGTIKPVLLRKDRLSVNSRHGSLHEYKLKGDISSLCILHPLDKTCWINKPNRNGIPISDMKGFYCLSKVDFEAIVMELYEAKNK